MQDYRGSKICAAPYFTGIPDDQIVPTIGYLKFDPQATRAVSYPVSVAFGGMNQCVRQTVQILSGYQLLFLCK